MSSGARGLEAAALVGSSDQDAGIAAVRELSPDAVVLGARLDGSVEARW
ncbi:hypothetical protein Rrhod_1386 [Rhodococcus rhodnii LMG 5362]|uniref:Uncharacterized protein n=1 Tax=Rhodococcus rhodnii LMG 5362 TaxID=1273125 RepID=R7WSY6_9NOCA|nr:hypothetical protein Rrhod_1386 [Rhodococcus rhodnii LMG 5362]